MIKMFKSIFFHILWYLSVLYEWPMAYLKTCPELGFCSAKYIIFAFSVFFSFFCFFFLFAYKRHLWQTPQISYSEIKEEKMKTYDSCTCLFLKYIFTIIRISKYTKNKKNSLVIYIIFSFFFSKFLTSLRCSNRLWTSNIAALFFSGHVLVHPTHRKWVLWSQVTWHVIECINPPTGLCHAHQ